MYHLENKNSAGYFDEEPQKPKIDWAATIICWIMFMFIDMSIITSIDLSIGHIINGDYLLAATLISASLLTIGILVKYIEPLIKIKYFTH